MGKSKFYLVIILLSIIACQKEEVVYEEGYLDETELSMVDSSFEAFKERYEIEDSTVREVDNYYIIDNDILFEKTTGKLKHARVQYIIDNDNQTEITVKVDESIPSSAVSTWRSAINQALANWNSITNCRLNFTLVTSGSADLVIRSDGGILRDYLVTSLSPYPLYYPVATAGTFPSEGKVGDEVLINTDVEELSVFGELSFDQKVYNVSHAIGHCVGFLHTDWYELEFDQYRYSAISIPGTVFAEPHDEYSIMNYQDLTRGWSFSSEDIEAIQYLYKGARVHIKYGNSYISVDNNWVVTLVQGMPGISETFLQVESFYAASGDPYFNFMTYDGVHYLQANSTEILATSPYPYSWQRFRIIQPYYGGVAIETYDSGYLAVKDGVLSTQSQHQPNVFQIMNSIY